MSRFYWILDNGHGGMIDGEYQTHGKRSPKTKEGQLFEGIFNREVVALISKILEVKGIDHTVLVPEQTDVSLPDRVSRIESICQEHANAVVLSIHANAGGGTGFEVYTSVGETLSDKLATVFCKELKQQFPQFKFRSDKTDGDPDKESQFYILRKTPCPAILTENLFMDNEKDLSYLLSPQAPVQIAAAHVCAILKCENYDS